MVNCKKEKTSKNIDTKTSKEKTEKNIEVLETPENKCEYKESTKFNSDIEGYTKMISSLDKKSLKSILISKDFIITKLPENIKLTTKQISKYAQFVDGILENYTVNEMMNLKWDKAENYRKIANTKSKVKHPIKNDNYLDMLYY